MYDYFILKTEMVNRASKSTGCPNKSDRVLGYVDTVPDSETERRRKCTG